MAVALTGLAMLVVGAAIDPDGQVLPGPAVEATVSSDTLAAADEARVQVVDLLGAMATTRSTARQYLIGVGELKPPVEPRPVRTVWDALAGCESNGRWSISTGNGFFGGLQFDHQTWLAYGGGVYAPTANLASKAQQIAVAERLRAARGFQPWPFCSRHLGLR